MRKDLYVGLSLTAGGLLVVLVGAWLDLELSAQALLGVAVGGVVALVPDRSAAQRVGGFAAGFVISWVGYFVRAGFMPDTETGRAVYVGIVLLLATAAALLVLARLPLWSVLLGAATFAGGYEQIYTDAPPLVTSTSVSAATALLLTTAVGFLAASWIGPERDEPTPPEPASEPEQPVTKDDDTVALDSMMGSKR